MRARGYQCCGEAPAPKSGSRLCGSSRHPQETGQSETQQQAPGNGQESLHAPEASKAPRHPDPRQHEERLEGVWLGTAGLRGFEHKDETLPGPCEGPHRARQLARPRPGCTGHTHLRVRPFPAEIGRDGHLTKSCRDRGNEGAAQSKITPAALHKNPAVSAYAYVTSSAGTPAASALTPSKG